MPLTLEMRKFIFCCATYIHVYRETTNRKHLSAVKLETQISETELFVYMAPIIQSSHSYEFTIIIISKLCTLCSCILAGYDIISKMPKVLLF